MKKARKWWKVPVILSAVLGFTPAMSAVASGVFFFASLRNEKLSNLPPGDLSTTFSKRIVGGLVILIFVLAAIWIPTVPTLVIRKLVRKTRDHKQARKAELHRPPGKLAAPLRGPEMANTAHPAEAFLIATREERARRIKDMPPMVSVRWPPPPRRGAHPPTGGVPPTAGQ